MNENYLSTNKTLVRISTAGSVDDGKSTLIGRLLHDTKAIYEDHIQGIAAKSKSGDELDLSLVMDGLKAEREQKITIDVAYRYFSTPNRHFILADTPGHVQYTRNMVTGASLSNVAIILVDVRKGLTEQTRRHAFISSLLGVPRIVVAVNKMDLVDYDESKFLEIKRSFEDFASHLVTRELEFIPVSALKGDNVVHRSEAMSWYKGRSLINYMEEVYIDSDGNNIDTRFPVQYVIRPNQDYRGFAGRIVSGGLKKGDDVVVLPRMTRTKVKSIDTFDGNLEMAERGQSVTVTLTDEVDVSRGDLICRVNNLPKISTKSEAIVIWMDEAKPASNGSTYKILHMGRNIRATISDIRYRFKIDDLSREETSDLSLNEIGRVRLESHEPLYVDNYRVNRESGNFVIIDESTNATVGAGIFTDRSTTDDVEVAVESGSEESVVTNLVEDQFGVVRDDREKKNGHKAITLWFTGLSGSGKSTVGRELERILYSKDCQIFRLDGDNTRMGLNRDLDFSDKGRSENIRRVAEVARILNDAGQIAICSFISPFKKDRDLAREIIGEENFLEVFVNTPIEVCESRDVKGLYARARKGEIADFTGISSPFEVPDLPDVMVSTQNQTAETCATHILNLIKGRIW